jgi:pSer/pThr/pTyr-binding forkhead associated (FHA) protein
MPKIVVMLEEGNPKEVSLSKQRTTVGRRPYNDVVLNDLAVSGEHLALHLSNGEVQVEDLGSTNGTMVNGQAVRQQALADGDVLTVGRVTIRFENPPLPLVGPASIRVLSGTSAGREMALTKPVTSMGKPGVVVAAISKQDHGYTLHRVEGQGQLTLNGSAVSQKPMDLRPDDEIVLAGTIMQFIQG